MEIKNYSNAELTLLWQTEVRRAVEMEKSQGINADRSFSLEFDNEHELAVLLTDFSTVMYTLDRMVLFQLLAVDGKMVLDIQVQGIDQINALNKAELPAPETWIRYENLPENFHFGVFKAAVERYYRAIRGEFGGSSA